MNTKTAFCFDLDGTVTKEEILPLLSKEVNLFDEMQALTMATINGVIPFENSFKLRTRILGEIPISIVQDIISKVNLHKHIVDFMMNNRNNCFILTGNLDIWMKKLLIKLNIKTYFSNANYENDKLLGVKKILNKGDAIDLIRKQGFDRIVAIGDGMGDVPMFNKADICIAFGGVHQPIQTLVESSNIIVFREESLCRTLNTL